MQSKLTKNFKTFIWQEKLFSEGEKLIVGISGGADSICLVELLLAVKEKFNLELLLVHINYHLRGEESDKDEEFVREFAEKKGLELKVVDYVESQKPSHFAEATRDKKVGEEVSDPAFAGRSANLEERLRDFRYKIFEEIRQKKKFSWIAVGHHQDDQAETFLLNLFRGAGIDGLKGMVVKNESRKIVRPLLNFSKQEITEFLQSIEQDWREDQSNQDSTFLRNKIRQQLIPEIEKEYSPQFKQRISDTTKQLQEYQAIIQKVVAENYSKVILEENSTKVILDISKYKKLTTEIKPLVFRQIIKNLKGDLKNITNTNYQEFQKIIQSTKGKKQKINFGGIEVENNKKEIVLSKTLK